MQMPGPASQSNDHHGLSREHELVERAKHDRQAFGELYERYVDRVYQYVYYRVGNRQDAEDLTARVFFRVLDALPRYRCGRAPFEAWLFKIARNLVSNWHRDQKQRRLISLDDMPLLQRLVDHEPPDRIAERRDEYEQLYQAIRALAEERQTLLYLKFIEGMSNAEIGEVLGKSEGAVKALYNRTLHTLRRELRKRGVHVGRR
ncbi:MAG: sigma-70 family RNA polymerase sigma factor [Ardenticatenia bacterium]|nr:sigma-70 family RNA polymerase sigma factor [Ardenticatenia bacterium]